MASFNLKRMILIFVAFTICIASEVFGQASKYTFSVRNGTLHTDHEDASKVRHMDPIICIAYDGGNKRVDTEVIGEGTDTFDSINGTHFSISAPGVESLGAYTCQVKEYPSHQKDVYINGIVGKPSDPSVSTTEGKDVTFECDFKAQPSVTIVWQYSKEDDGTRKSLPTARFEPADHKLSISDVKPEDRAYYYCTASNSAVNVTMKTFLRVRSKLAPLWPFLGIVIQCILLFLIIFFCDRHKQGKKAAKERREANGTDGRAAASGAGTSEAVRRRN